MYLTEYQFYNRENRNTVKILLIIAKESTVFESLFHIACVIFLTHLLLHAEICRIYRMNSHCECQEKGIPEEKKNWVKIFEL